MDNHVETSRGGAWITRRVGLTAALVLAQVPMLAPNAHGASADKPPSAGVVAIYGSHLYYEAAPGGYNSIVVTKEAGTYYLNDAVRLTPGPGCYWFTNDHTIVACQGSSVTYLWVESHDMDDMISNQTSLSSYMSGGGANDTIYGGHSNDQIDGGEGRDTIWGGGGNDYINLGAGGDPSWQHRETAGGEGGDDNVTDPDGWATIWGGRGKDTLIGGPGDDTTVGEDGNDTLQGWGGNDTLEGRDGDDTLHGSDGDDVLFGGKDKDLLDGGSGTNQLDGGENSDKCVNGPTKVACES